MKKLPTNLNNLKLDLSRNNLANNPENMKILAQTLK